MLVFIPAETRAGERRVGLTPEGAQKLIKLGLTVSIQEGAGQEQPARPRLHIGQLTLCRQGKED